MRSDRGLELTNAALVDCTANPSIVDAYPAFIDANLHIITPNKRANALPWRRYAALMRQMAPRQKHFFYEANVGAGLPIMSTLRDLIASGDEILKIEASCPERSAISSTRSTARVRSASSCARRTAWGSPSRIRATTSRGRTSRASS